MLDNTIDKIKSIELPKISCKNTVITISIIGTGFFLYNHSKTIINSMKNILLGNCCEKTVCVDKIETNENEKLSTISESPESPNSQKSDDA